MILVLVRGKTSFYLVHDKASPLPESFGLYPGLQQKPGVSIINDVGITA